MTTSSTDRRLVTLVLLVLAAVLIIPALTMGFGMMGYGPMMGGGMWGGGMGPGGMWGDGSAAPGWALLVGGLMQLLFIAVLVGIGYLIFRTVTRSGREDQALEELRLAYARGDLTDDEFEERRERLQADASNRE